MVESDSHVLSFVALLVRRQNCALRKTPQWKESYDCYFLHTQATEAMKAGNEGYRIFYFTTEAMKAGKPYICGKKKVTRLIEFSISLIDESTKSAPYTLAQIILKQTDGQVLDPKG
uniref:Uncharacterized protein n=1 Tax=Nelumbo nucifera TaxID=4432 RepID=A0A822YM51_NELNU|nr:TPA_asm: hypothetical protein HUJ06_011512 [Nelumbo nucifera]